MDTNIAIENEQFQICVPSPTGKDGTLSVSTMKAPVATINVQMGEYSRNTCNLNEVLRVIERNFCQLRGNTHL